MDFESIRIELLKLRDVAQLPLLSVKSHPTREHPMLSFVVPMFVSNNAVVEFLETTKLHYASRIVSDTKNAIMRVAKDYNADACVELLAAATELATVGIAHPDEGWVSDTGIMCHEYWISTCFLQETAKLGARSLNEVEFILEQATEEALAQAVIQSSLMRAVFIKHRDDFVSAIASGAAFQDDFPNA